MKTRPTRLNFESLEQVIHFETSRFPFATEDKKIALRKIYRDLEAIFRDSIRDLENDLDEGDCTPQSLQIQLCSVESSIRRTCSTYIHSLTPEMKENLENLCMKLGQISENAENCDELNQMPIELITDGFYTIKRSLGVIHKI